MRVEDITSDHEFLLLACDGIWDVLTNQEVVEFVRARIAQRMQPEIVSISHWMLNVVHTLCHLKYAHVEFNYLCHFSVDKWENVSTFYTPAPLKVEWGYTGFTPMSVSPSVRPSVDKVSGTFWKNYWLNSFHTWQLPLWGESLDPYSFSCS